MNIYLAELYPGLQDLDINVENKHHYRKALDKYAAESYMMVITSDELLKDEIQTSYSFRKEYINHKIHPWGVHDLWNIPLSELKEDFGDQYDLYEHKKVYMLSHKWRNEYKANIPVIPEEFLDEYVLYNGDIIKMLLSKYR